MKFIEDVKDGVEEKDFIHNMQGKYFWDLRF